MTDSTPLPDPSGQPARPWAGHLRGSAAYQRILFALGCAGLATFAQLYSVQAVLPSLARDLHVTAADAALSVSAATLGLALSVIPWSQAADRLGRLRVMTIAVVAATVLGLSVPLSPDFTVLILLRFCEGLALGGIPAVALAYLSEEVSRLHAAVAAGTYVAGTTLGGLAGRLIAGPVADLTNWRMGLAAVSALAAMAAVGFVLAAPKPRGFTPVARGSESLWSKLAVNLKSRPLFALYLQGFLLMGGFVAVYNYLGFRLEAAPFGLPQTLTSMLFTVYVAGTWSSRTAGSLAGRRGRKTVLLGSTAVMAAGLGITLLPWLPAILAGLLLFTAGFFAAHAIASGWTPHRAERGRAQASALYNLMYYAGSSLFGWLGGLFFQGFGWGVLVAFVGVLIGLAALFSALWLRSGADGP